MAQTEHLPIYKSTYDLCKSTYDLCLYLEQVVHNFSRYHKYALGADLRDGARRALKLVVRANARRDKTPVLLQPQTSHPSSLLLPWWRVPTGNSCAL